MIKTKRLKSRLETMIQMKTKQQDRNHIKNHIARVFEEAYNKQTHVFVSVARIIKDRVNMTEFGLNKKVREVNDQENKNNRSCVNHKFRKIRQLAVTLFVITHRTCDQF